MTTGRRTTQPPPAGQPVWVRRVTSWWVAAACALGVAVDLRTKHSVPRKVVGIGVVAAFGTALSTIRVVVGRSGLTVGLGPWGWPARRFERAAIRQARTEIVSVLDYGGLGYRWRPGSTRIVLRGGEALVVDLERGGSFGVTVPDAERAAALLNER